MAVFHKLAACIAVGAAATENDAIQASSRFLGRRQSEEAGEDMVASTLKHFESFKQSFERAYDSEEEEATRLGNFKTALREVETLNKKNGDPVFGITYAADFLEEELASAFMSGFVLNGSDWEDMSLLSVAPDHGPRGRRLAKLPPALNWARTKAVTAIKSQGSCGACWAFAAAETIESMYVLYGTDSNQQVFSPQQIASCAKGSGCGGGNPINAWNYLMKSEVPGLAQEVFWPYTQGLTPRTHCADAGCTESCHIRDIWDIISYQPLIGPYAQVENAYFAITPCKSNVACDNQDLDGLARTLAEVGPLAIAVNAKTWRFYKGGVMTSEACGENHVGALDHAVQLVGYNTTAPVPYWIVRNTWTTMWGEGGYIYLDKRYNTCGLANLVSYPEVIEGKNWGRKLGAEESEESNITMTRFDRLFQQAADFDDHL
jgi:C1A family cysteine protease